MCGLDEADPPPRESRDSPVTWPVRALSHSGENHHAVPAWECGQIRRDKNERGRKRKEKEQEGVTGRSKPNHIWSFPKTKVP